MGRRPWLAGTKWKSSGRRPLLLPPPPPVRPLGGSIGGGGENSVSLDEDDGGVVDMADDLLDDEDDDFGCEARRREWLAFIFGLDAATGLPDPSVVHSAEEDQSINSSSSMYSPLANSFCR